MTHTEIADALVKLSAAREKAEIVTSYILECHTTPKEVQLLAYIASDYLFTIRQTVETLHREFAV